MPTPRLAPLTRRRTGPGRHRSDLLLALVAVLACVGMTAATGYDRSTGKFVVVR